ncbi:hypothetical protein DWC20_16095 [Clostridium botulinum]|uniref:hypothetical protein n=1 Tax=Clostridium botulinum TaxID=1491 RepID=UPI0003781152|nr:hypothetical protein [Clostridium botulinum]MBN1037057.1 hypothetical protein [Clostridium botulinum]
MIRSGRITQIARILREVKEEIFRYPEDEGVSVEEFNWIVDQKIKKVAGDLGINSSSCTDKVTRQLDCIGKEQFKDELWDFFTDRVPAEQTKLGGRIVSNKTNKDNKKSVIAMLDSIKNH